MFPRIAALLLLLAGVARVAHAASPHLGAIDPPGVQAGADTDVTISGQHLQDAQGLLFYTPGIQVLSWQPVDQGKVHARLRVAPDCPLGDHEVRVWTSTGISEMRPFYVGPFPNVACSGSDHTIARAQPVPLNCTVNGIIHDEEIDYFSIQAKRGDRITAEVEGMRLGRDMFDPWASIMDAHGRQLAANDDNPLFLQDPLTSTIAPADGAYLISVRESTWGGSPESLYRLHIGAYPQPLAVYPSGGPAGQNLPVIFIGDVKGPVRSTVQLPRAPGVPFAAPLADHGLLSPGPLPMRVSPFPNVLEQAPDNDIAHATPGPPPPVAFNGILAKPHETDFFRFHATHGAALDITVYARQLRSPLDSVLDLWDAKGKHLASNDDSIGPDSYLRFNVPADGDYCLSVHDQLYRGGFTFVYRVEVVPVLPSVSFTVPEIVRNSQERQTIVVPRGNRYATLLRVKSDGFDGDFQLNLPSMPHGVTLQSGIRSGDVMPVIFQAAPDAVVTAALSDVLAQPADPTQHVSGGYAQTVELIHGAPNDYAYLKTDINRLAISVAAEAPFRIDLVPPPFPVLQNGQSSLKVTAIRQPGFTGPINVSMLYNPPGVSSQSIVTIPGDQTSVDLPINASQDAKSKTWQIAAIASADTGQGAIWISSALVPLTVSKPYVSAHLDRANTIQGYPVAITCHFDQNIPFDGSATVRLMGLPGKVSAPDIQITSADKQGIFNVTTDPTTPPGNHRDLFCQVTVEKDGVKIVANTASGGALRIDPAAKKEVAVQ
jgi:hypothetical protein